MASTSSLLADPRRRNLAVLAVATIVMVVIAVAALHYEANETGGRYTPETFFPALASELRSASRIHVEGSKGAFDIVFVPGKGWVIPERNGYPASLDEVRQTLVGLAALETIEPKTARPDWYRYVDLDGPPRDNSVLIRVANSAGDVLASLIIGKSEDIGDPGGAVGLFVRRPGDPQSWLLRSVFEPKADPGDWMDKAVMNVDRARIQEVEVTPASGPAYVVRRDKPSDPDFVLTPIPGGRVLANEAAPDGVAAAISGFAFDDSTPASRLDFSKPTRLVTKTFDGLTVTVNAISAGPIVWATVAADSAPGNQVAQKEAAAINARAARWAFRLPDYKGQQFMTTLESQLKPLAAPAKTAP